MTMTRRKQLAPPNDVATRRSPVDIKERYQGDLFAVGPTCGNVSLTIWAGVHGRKTRLMEKRKKNPRPRLTRATKVKTDHAGPGAVFGAGDAGPDSNGVAKRLIQPARITGPVPRPG